MSWILKFSIKFYCSKSFRLVFVQIVTNNYNRKYKGYLASWMSTVQDTGQESQIKDNPRPSRTGGQSTLTVYCVNTFPVEIY